MRHDRVHFKIKNLYLQMVPDKRTTWTLALNQLSLLLHMNKELHTGVNDEDFYDIFSVISLF